MVRARSVPASLLPAVRVTGAQPSHQPCSGRGHDRTATALGADAVVELGSPAR